MNNRYRIIIPLLAVGIAMSGLALQMAAADSVRNLDRLAQQLDLSEAQQTALSQLRHATRTSRRGTREKRAEVIQLIRSGQADAAADLAAQSARDRVYRHAEHRASLAAILTPQQLAEFDALRSERRGRGNRSRRGR